MQLVVEKVTKIFGIDGSSFSAVNGVSLTIERGEFISIIGHSGSGKTTLLSILGGIARPTSGRVLFEGTDIYSFSSDKLSEYRCEKIGFIFQFASLLPMLTAKENLMLPVSFHSGQKHAKDAEEVAQELLSLVGLEKKMNAYPAQLSGGQQRRIAIARAFMNSPELVLADEPTGDLDEETEDEMMKLFTSLNRERGMTFLMVTHNTELAGRAKRKIKMHDGIVAEL